VGAHNNTWPPAAIAGHASACAAVGSPKLARNQPAVASENESMTIREM